MENLIPKNGQKETSETPDSLIRKWLVVLAETFQFELPESNPGVPSLADAWVLSLSDRTVQQLNAAFQKLLKNWKPDFGRKFPCPADLVSLTSKVESSATGEAADKAWQRILEIRRVHWNPDIPGPFDRAVAKLSERVRTAARAAGVWRDFTAEEYESGALHTWAKKRFIESFIAWGELQQDQFLLPDGEVKNLLTEVAKTKAL